MSIETLVGGRPLRIFLSSTARDLPDHRAAVIDVLDRLGHAPVHMETFGALPGLSLDECAGLAAGADALIVIVADRYGWVPNSSEGGDGERSITWYEVEAAQRAARPVFPYLRDDVALPAGSDDSARLARFRAFLRRQPCETYSTPDDLAKKVAVTVGQWSRGVSRDFALALQLINVEQRDSEAVNFAALHRIKLIEAAMAPTAISAAELAQLVEGPHTHMARDAVEAHRASSAALLSPLELQRSKTLAHLSELKTLIDTIAAEKPPWRPDAPIRPPSQLGEPLPGWMLDQYEKSLEDHRAALSRYEMSARKHQERQATLPHVRQQMGDAQLLLQQIEREIAQLASAREIELNRLKAEIGSAQDDDITALLEAMRDSAMRQSSEPAMVAQGFLELLATEAVCSFLSSRRPGSTASTLHRDRVHEEVCSRADEIAARDHQLIGMALLALLVPLRSAQLDGRNRTGEVRASLDSLPPNELRDACAQANALRARQAPALQPYQHLLNPQEIEGASVAVSDGVGRLRETTAEIESFLAAAESLIRECRTVHQAVDSILSGMQGSASRLVASLSECDFLWRLISHGAQGDHVGRKASDLCNSLQSEASRRMGESVESLVATCRRTNFGVMEAEETYRGHLSTHFMEAMAALRTRRAELVQETQTFEETRTGLSRQPGIAVSRYNWIIKTAALLALVPLINLLVAHRTGLTIRRYETGLRSGHPLYRPLVRLSVWCICAAAVLSLALGGVVYMAPDDWLPVGEVGVRNALTLCYFANALLWIRNGSLLHAARRQVVHE